MDPVLVDGRGRPQNTQRIEQVDPMSLGGEPDCNGRAVDAGSRDGDPRFHCGPLGAAGSTNSNIPP